MKLLRSFSIYTIVGFLGAGINFLVMPLLTHYLTPKDFGVTSLLNTYVTILIPFIGLVSSSYISVEYFNIEGKKEFARLFSSILLIPVIPSILLYLITLLNYNSLAAILELPLDNKWLVLCIFPISLLCIYIDTILNLYAIKNKVGINSILNIGKIVVEVSLTILFVVVYKMGWQGRFLSWFLSTVLLSLVMFLMLNKEKLLVFSVRWTYMKAAIIFGAPLILHTVGKFIINQSDRLFIAKMISVDEAGIYSVGYTFGTIILILSTALSNIFYPYTMERMKDLNSASKKQILRITYFGIAGIAGVVVLLSLAVPLLFKYVMDKRYLEGGIYVVWVSIGYLFWGAYSMFSGYIYYFKKTAFLGVLAIINVIINIALNYFLIKAFGGIGAAYATAISFFINFIIIYVKVTSLLPWLRIQNLFIESRD